MRSLPSSKFVRFLSWFMIGFPVVYLVFTAFIFDLNTTGILAIVLSPMYYIASVLWVLTGLGIRRMQKWSWYTFAFAQLCSFYFNALNLVNYSQSQYKGIAFVIAILIQLYIWMVLRRELRVPYLFPKIKWWESGIAGMNHISVRVESTSGETKVGQILDINTRGAFVKCSGEFSQFEKIKIFIDHEPVSNLEVPASIVWMAQSSVTHPKGVGVKFYGIDRESKKKLKNICQRFERENNQ